MKNATKMVVILDRSGSMASVKASMEEIMNGFIALQKQEPGECTFSLVTFDDVIEFPEGFQNVPLSTVGHIKIGPRNSTALLDAVGSTIDRVGRELAAMPESERPNKIMITVVTDGHENASREYVSNGPNRSQRVFDMVRHQRDVYNWHFQFMSADQDAIATACSMGIDAGSALNYSNTRSSIKGMGTKLSKMSSGFRAAESASMGIMAARGICGQSQNRVTQEDETAWDTSMADLRAKGKAADVIDADLSVTK